MRYEAPRTVEQAVALLQGESGLSRVLAGGTDVLVQLRAGLVPDAFASPNLLEILRKAAIH